MTIVGLSVGAGFFQTGIAVTVLLLIILTVLDYIEDHYIPSIDRMHLTVSADDRPGLLAEIQNVLNIKKRNMGAETMERDLENASVVFNSSLRVWNNKTSEAIIQDLFAIEGVRKVKIDK